jgi:hypothetical protein
VPRKTRDFKLPRLTVQEAARLLGVPYEQFRLWLFERVEPTPSEWSRWNNERDVGDRNKSRPLPDTVIRLYLAWLRGLKPAPMTPELPAPADAVPKPPTAKRASGKRG